MYGLYRPMAKVDGYCLVLSGDVYLRIEAWHIHNQQKFFIINTNPAKVKANIKNFHKISV